MNYNTCQHCGKSFESVREDAVFCSKSCASTASRRRTAARAKAAEDLLGRIVIAMNHSTEDVGPLVAEARRLLSGGGYVQGPRA